MDFQTLLENYPQDYQPCRCNDTGYSNFEKYDGVKCWHNHDGQNHTLRVEELVKFLKKKLPKDILTIAKSEDYVFTSEDFEGLTGIVAFINFWGDGNQGDHIDLWNEDCLLTGDVDFFERSEKVIFWEID